MICTCRCEVQGPPKVGAAAFAERSWPRSSCRGIENAVPVDQFGSPTPHRLEIMIGPAWWLIFNAVHRWINKTG
jgi:hypothetical protein